MSQRQTWQGRACNLNAHHALTPIQSCVVVCFACRDCVHRLHSSDALRAHSADAEPREARALREAAGDEREAGAGHGRARQGKGPLPSGGESA